MALNELEGRLEGVMARNRQRVTPTRLKAMKRRKRKAKVKRVAKQLGGFFAAPLTEKRAIRKAKRKKEFQSGSVVSPGPS